MKRNSLKKLRLLLHEVNVLFFRRPKFRHGEPFQCREVVTLDFFVMEDLVFWQLNAHTQEVLPRQEHQFAVFECLNVKC